MQRAALILFVAFELLYYLLIAQTGIVEYFHSDMTQIIYLPVGGVLGAVFVMFCTLSRKTLLLGLLAVQTLITFFYPDFSHLALFILGLSVGGIAPLLVYHLKQQKHFDMGIALIIAYSVGTFLFTYAPASRLYLGLSFSVLAFLSVWVLKRSKQIDANEPYKYIQLATMSLWVFFDSALFETLSRDSVIPIWRGEYTVEIIVFHILGVLGAYYIPVGKKLQAGVILALFSISYVLYFTQHALVLSVVYPFVISYYNVVILQHLIRIKDFRQIGISMIMIGWVASGAGLMVALEGLIVFVPVIFVGIISYSVYTQLHFKEIHYV